MSDTTTTDQAPQPSKELQEAAKEVAAFLKKAERREVLLPFPEVRDQENITFTLVGEGKAVGFECQWAFIAAMSEEDLSDFFVKVVMDADGALEEFNNNPPPNKPTIH